MIIFHRLSPSHLSLRKHGCGPHLRAWPTSVYVYEPSEEKDSKTKEAKYSTNNKETQEEHSSERTLLYHDQKVRVSQQEEALQFEFDMPGVKSGDIEAELDDGVLRVRAERKSGGTVKAKYYQSFALDAKTIDSSSVTAQLEDGVLFVNIAKKEVPKPVIIPIEKGYTPEESEKEVVRRSLDVPGVQAGDLKIQFNNEELVIQGERKRGRFVSKIYKRLPARGVDDPTLFKAFLSDGVLTIVGPRTTSGKKKIVVSGKNGEIGEFANVDRDNKRIPVVETVEERPEEVIAATKPSINLNTGELIKEVEHAREHVSDKQEVKAAEEPASLLVESDNEWEKVVAK